MWTKRIANINVFTTFLTLAIFIEQKTIKQMHSKRT